MLIRLILFAVFFLWVIRAPLEYRAHVAEEMAKDNTQIRLNQREAKYGQVFLQAMKLPVGDKLRLQAIYDLAQVRWQQMNFENAAQLYKWVILETKLTNKYHEDLVKTQLSLAAVLGSGAKYAEETKCYLNILDYDRKFLSVLDPRIGRDLNNLGVNFYLQASRQDRGNERTALLNKANDYLEQALKTYTSTSDNRQKISVALFNKYLVLRDLGLTKEANIAKQKAEAIETACNRLYNAP